MSIQYAILGFLNWQSLTGYELKKMFADSATFHWSGNNNQIYRTLVKLHEGDLVTREVQQQENLPARKIYTITDKGREALKEWLLASPDVPQVKNSFLIQLAWADQLTAEEQAQLIAKYEEEIQARKLMMQEQARRKKHYPQRTKREIYLWQMISENWISYYQNELDWIHKLRQGLEQI